MRSQQPTLRRRDFLAGVVSLTLTGGLVRGEKGPVIGHGDFRYRVHAGWGDLDPEEHPVNDCHAMVEDSLGRILLLTNNTANNVLIYNKEGDLRDTWGDAYPGAHGMTLVQEDGQDRLWLTDHNRHQVYKTGIDGKLLKVLDYPKDTGKYPAAANFKPTDVAVAPDGSFYVCDGYGLSYVIRYAPDGTLERIFGGPGDAPENLATPHGALVDTRDPDNPVLIVASRGQEALKRFRLNGDYIDTVPMPGAKVCDLARKGDHLYVAHLNGFCSVLDRDNRVVSNPGGSEPVYKDGKLQKMRKTTDVFIHPHDILADSAGDLYVPQWNSNQTYPIKLVRV